MPANRNEFQRIGALMDFSKAASKAYDNACFMAQKNAKELKVFCVLNEYSKKQLQQQNKNFASQEDLRSILMEMNNACNVNLKVSDSKWRSVIEAEVKKENGLSEIFLGYQNAKDPDLHVTPHMAYKMAKITNVPVFCWNESADSNLKEILLPFDTNKHSREKLYYGVLLAQMYQARLHLLLLNTNQTHEEQMNLRNAGRQIEDYVVKNGLAYWIEERKSNNVVKTVLDYIDEKQIHLLLCSVEMEYNLSDIFKGSTPARIAQSLNIQAFFIPERVSWGMIDVTI